MEMGTLEQAFGPSRTLVYENETGLKVFEKRTLSRNNATMALSLGHYYVAEWTDKEGHVQISEVSFQDGPIPANGVNGLTSEAVLAILIHRTSTLNANFPCEENELAILHMKKALDWFNTRTAKRKARGVEGKNVV